MVVKQVFSFRWWRLSLPTTLWIIALAIYLFRPLLFPVQGTLLHKIEYGLVLITGSWILNRLINIVINYYLKRKDYGKSDNLKERQTYTRIGYIKRLINIIILLIAVGLALRQFAAMRDLSTGILASAGIIGVVLAFAAQKILANILAGLQIAFAQPLRIDDVVIVEGEWGRIEEINTTNIIVKIWDQRRLVVPITYFVEHPFENWTKKSADIWGTTTFYVDYLMSVDAMRKELDKILAKSTFWDGKIKSVQVVETTEQTMKVRCLMSAKDSSMAWDLRCEVREKMIAFLQKKYPHHLPRIRADVTSKKR